MSLADLEPIAPSRQWALRQPALKPTPAWSDTGIEKNAPTVKCGVPLLDLKDADCRWPVSTEPYLFCGAAKARGSYCAAHAALAYREPEPR